MFSVIRGEQARELAESKAPDIVVGVADVHIIRCKLLFQTIMLRVPSKQSIQSLENLRKLERLWGIITITSLRIGSQIFLLRLKKTTERKIAQKQCRIFDKSHKNIAY